MKIARILAYSSILILLLFFTPGILFVSAFIWPNIIGQFSSSQTVEVLAHGDHVFLPPKWAYKWGDKIIDPLRIETDNFAEGNILAIALVLADNQSPTSEKLGLELLNGDVLSQKLIGAVILAKQGKLSEKYFEADALGAINDERAIPVLEEAMNSPNFYALPNGFEALVKMSDKNAVPLAINRVSPTLKGYNSGQLINSLEDHTGKNFGFDKQRWNEWWAQGKSSN